MEMSQITFYNNIPSSVSVEIYLLNFKYPLWLYKAIVGKRLLEDYTKYIVGKFINFQPKLMKIRKDN
jgi:hypothetical protein